MTRATQRNRWRKPTVLKALKRPTYRLYLDEINPGYAPGDGEDRLYLDLYLGLTMGDQQRINQFGITQFEENDVKRQAEAEGKARVDFSQRWYDADNEYYTVYVEGSNITKGIDGQDIPPATTKEFWAAMPQDIKDAVLNVFSREANKRRARLTGTDFPRPPASS